jgi:hypothetical protein
LRMQLAKYEPDSTAADDDDNWRGKRSSRYFFVDRIFLLFCRSGS